MKRVIVVLLGLLSFWPLAYAYLLYIYPSVFSFLMTVTFFEIFGLLAFYICFIFKTNHVPAEKRALWTTVLIFGNTVTIPFFWYLYFWKTPAIPHQATEDDVMPGEVDR